jgi:hypothetical protein
MTLSAAIALALSQGCELDPVPNSQGRYCIRAIGYDADPAEITEAELFQLTEAQFLAEWMPERYYGH